MGLKEKMGHTVELGRAPHCVKLVTLGKMGQNV